MTVRDLLTALPDVPTLRDRCRALAALEAVMDPVYGHFSYAPAWSDREQVALMDNGSGDDYAIVFSDAGAYARGFAHESVMSPYADEDEAPWPGLVDAVPEAFRPYVTEPAFCDDLGAGPVPRATVVFWREAGDTAWHTGPVEMPTDGARGFADGADFLFDVLAAGTPEAYRDFAADYYERPVDLDAVRHVFALRPLSGAVALALNPAAVAERALEAARATGYPVAS
ncbi:hypothetical protein ACIOD1_05655 [Streptomyces sp. NPDC088097]|uniref:hypothetical protein n=1 Tax=Streptomyces sp. NPDC088097 TaxID=3365823 RepID=UPI0037F41D27